ncbi:MAG: sulfotransferase, partial [Gammaproteobacteria bacterium]|nr:sulfotransferase [Gammaproteobacteria bacterium]
MIIWYLGAVVVGGLFGYLFGLIFRRWTVPGTTGRYWSEVGKNIHGLLHGAEEQFWLYYKRVISGTLVYVFRQLVALVLAFTPLLVAFFVLGPWVFSRWAANAPMAVIPEDAGTLSIGEALSTDDAPPRYALTLDNGLTVDVFPESGSQVVCPPASLSCLILRGFGFSSITVDESDLGDNTMVIVRATHEDRNPFWPYLSDPEFLFFVSLTIGSVLAVMRGARDGEAAADSYQLGLTDYALTQFATHYIHTLNRLGEWETRRSSSRLSGIQVTKPVFIGGLARSGTTVLLEKLSTISGVATHRYRDFPFIMTPIFWNKVLSFVGAKQKPLERPHRDQIKITRDSPDAFEEPIWQHYFPSLHDTGKLHRLDASCANTEFERFYRQHIQKILLVRQGSRYVSKGNYNLPRFEYIDEIFDDSRFIVPIRHPLMHIESLARQHEIFVAYAESDPRIASYL